MNGATELEIERWSRSLRSAPVVWLSAALALSAAALLWLRGAGFYALPLAERISHSDYPLLSPSHAAGRVYGLVGAGLILLNLAYLARRCVPHWPLGRMRVWLDVHVVTGITATVFVAFHSAFQLRSPVAMMTAATLAITVASGIIGRFFYAFAPSGEAPSMARAADLDALLPGVGKPLNEGLGKLAPRAVPAGSGLWGVLRVLPGWRRDARARRAFVHAVCAQWLARADELELAYAAPLVGELAQLAAGEVYGVAARALLRAWRPWHRACALTMVAGILLHVGVALFYGYGWDFGS